MKTARQQSLQNVATLMAKAFTQEEIDEAQAAKSVHIKRYPQDANTEFAHGFHHQVEAAIIRRQEADTLGLSLSERAKRERFLHSFVRFGDPVNNERDRQQFLHTYEEVRNWLSHYPADASALSALRRMESERELLLLVLGETALHPTYVPS